MGAKIDTRRTEIDRFESAAANNRLLLKQERLILEVTELLSVALGESRLTKTELARRLGKTKGFVSQLFSGGRNLTLRSISDIADALGVMVSFQTKRHGLSIRNSHRAASVPTRRAAP